MRSPSPILTLMTDAYRTERLGDWHRGATVLLKSSGTAKITEALSPIIPAGVIAGAPFPADAGWGRS
jgi:hypothetical protein